MSDIALSVEGVRKSYLIGGEQAPYSTIRDSITSGLVAPVKRAARLLRGEAYGATNLDEEFWALDGVSFEVAAGEVLGIIGPNGAGKTTLLKILSRITEPTEGRVRVFGRVASLLEVGTGFHPELTGRENVQLNGAILGMRRADLQRRFDEIVDFAEVGQFIDTPVKFYSTGMQVRLAFSVAAHLEPDILLVDEVLAVGDVAFQRKCIGKMESATGEGRTVVFVSHNVGTVGRLCDTGILLEHGKITHNGRIDEAIARYLETVSGGDSGGESIFQPDDNKSMAISSIRVLDAEGNVSTALDRAGPFFIEVTYRVNKQINDAFVDLVLSTADDSARVCVSRDTDAADGDTMRRSPGVYTARIKFPGGILNVNSYYARIGLVRSRSRGIDLQRTPTFELYDAGDLGNYQTSLAPRDRSVVVLPIRWDTERSP